jgi:hypothetical protein
MSFRDAVIREPKTKEVEAFGKTVTVIEMEATDRLEYYSFISKIQDDSVSSERAGVLNYAYIVVKCAVENGERVFSDDEVEAVAKTKDFDSLANIYHAAADLNGLRTEGND